MLFYDICSGFFYKAIIKQSKHSKGSWSCAVQRLCHNTQYKILHFKQVYKFEGKIHLSVTFVSQLCITI